MFYHFIVRYCFASLTYTLETPVLIQNVGLKEHVLALGERSKVNHMDRHLDLVKLDDESIYDSTLLLNRTARNMAVLKNFYNKKYRTTVINNLLFFTKVVKDHSLLQIRKINTTKTIKLTDFFYSGRQENTNSEFNENIKSENFNILYNGFCLTGLLSKKCKTPFASFRKCNDSEEQAWKAIPVARVYKDWGMEYNNLIHSEIVVRHMITDFDRLSNEMAIFGG